MTSENYSNAYKEIHMSSQAKRRLQELLDNPTQDNLAFKSDFDLTDTNVFSSIILEKKVFYLSFARGKNHITHINIELDD